MYRNAENVEHVLRELESIDRGHAECGLDRKEIVIVVQLAQIVLHMSVLL